MSRSPTGRPRPIGRARLAAGVVVALGVAVPAQALAGAHVAGSHHVVIRGYAFRPGNLAIRSGDNVTWLFEDGSTAHNVAVHGYRSSHTQRQGSFTIRFTRRGSFSYVCTLHPWMTGRISVH